MELDLSVVWVIGFVLVLGVILDRILLRPLTRVMSEREGAIRAARDLADASRSRASDAVAEFEAKTREARSEFYRQMDETRRVALDRRAEIVAATRHEVEQMTSQATIQLQAQATKARAELERDADQMAATIVNQVLGRQQASGV